MNTTLSRRGEDRFVIVDAETGEIIDDAQGYGYKTKKKAYASWAYKNRDKSKDAEYNAKRKRIREWMREHKSFIRTMDQVAFEIEGKKSWAPDDHFNTALVRQMLKDANLDTDFDAKDLLKEWQKS